MHPAHRLRWSAFGFVAILLAACGTSPSAAPSLAMSLAPLSTNPPVSSASPSVVPLPAASLPPPSATVTFGGGVTGVAKGIQVNCESPALSGLIITLFGATNRKGVSTTVTIATGSVAVTLDSGSGATFAARTFTGIGVSAFDATKGAQIDSPLTEVVTSSNPGTVPAVTSIKGNVDCGNQVPGSSTLTLAGSAQPGVTISGPIDPIRVDCNPNAKPASVHAVGVIKVGPTPALIVFQATANGFTAYIVATVTTLQHFYTTTDPKSATISPTGVHVSGSAAESGTTNTLTVSGDLVCGVINP